MVEENVIPTATENLSGERVVCHINVFWGNLEKFGQNII